MGIVKEVTNRVSSCFIIRRLGKRVMKSQIIMENIDMSEIKKDDAYGMVRVSRVMGSDRSLFGSSIEHRNTVQIEISNGRLERERCFK